MKGKVLVLLLPFLFQFRSSINLFELYIFNVFKILYTEPLLSITKMNSLLALLKSTGKLLVSPSFASIDYLIASSNVTFAKSGIKDTIAQYQFACSFNPMITCGLSIASFLKSKTKSLFGFIKPALSTLRFVSFSDFELILIICDGD